VNTDRRYPPIPRPSSWSSPTPTTPGAPIDDEARKELLATIAASRDLGPEMDHTLAERYLERLTQRQARYTQWQARSWRLTAANLRRFWPLAVALAAGLGALMLVGLMVALALHGGPPHNFGHSGAAFNNGGYPGRGAPDGPGGPGGRPDGGFFPLFGMFFWALPLLALILFLRRRVALRRARGFAGYSRFGPSSPGANRPYRSQSLPAAQSDDPYAQYAPDDRYEPYQPYQPFDYATASIPTTSPTSIPTPRPTRVFVEEVGLSAPSSPASATPAEDIADAVNLAVGDGAVAGAEPSAGLAPTTPPRPPAPPTGPLGNPAG